MIIMKKLTVIVAALALCPAVSFADNMAVSGKVGSLGLGVELTKTIANNVTGRVGINVFDYNTNTTRNTVNYDMKLQLQTITVTADWYPMSGDFRTSAGMFYNNNRATFNARNIAGAYTINGTAYAAGAANDITSLQGSATFNSLAPYIGIGWGNPAAKKNKGWGFVADLGVMYQGTPKATLTGTCGAAQLLTCAAVQANIAAEQIKLQAALNNFTWYPVASIGVSYKW